MPVGKDTPWENRARWALALQSLEDTPYGSFHLCDIKKDIIGIVEGQKGMIAKALDVHTSRFGDALTYRVRNRSCKNDADCSLGHCLVECS